ncbi:MAG: hypothetical protein WD712_01560 [Candidatus Spechtbacterales bacterium]
MNILKEQKGVSLFISILILSAIMAIGLGVSSLLMGEIEVSRDISRFVPAIYAADSGIERVLYKIRKNGDFASCPGTSSCVVNNLSNPMGNGATYSAIVLDSGVQWCPGGSSLCIRGLGKLVDTHRGFEVTF